MFVSFKGLQTAALQFSRRPAVKHSVRLAGTHATSAINQPIGNSHGTHGHNAMSKAGDVVINKIPVAMDMTADVYSYLLKHTREPEVLAKLRAATASVHGAHMQITPEQGQLLALLVELIGAQNAIEVGVFTGYSALSVALALPKDGRLMALDKDPNTMEMAKRFFAEAGVAHKVVDMVGPASDSLRKLLEVEGPGSFDFAFLDADKPGYWEYYELLLQLMRPGGLIVVDNILFHGRVADPKVTDKATSAIREFNERIITDQRVTLSNIPVGDGIALCRKR